MSSLSFNPAPWRLVLLAMSAFLVPEGPARGEDPTYEQEIEFLKQHTQVLELTDGADARVAICPAYQGRVMTSTADGPAGRSHGWINREFISAGREDKVFNNFGGEDRFWLAPEAGQFALFFAPRVEQTFANWVTPPQMNEGPFTVTSTPADPFVRLTRSMILTNAATTRFNLDITRSVRLLQQPQFAALFGVEAGRLLAPGGLPLVGFETDNTITNRGDAMDVARGLVSIWTLGQFKPGPHTWIIVPYRAGDVDELGPIVDSSYFNHPGADRLKIREDAVLLRADAQFRSKIGINQRRARPVLGSIDLDAGVLTIVSFSMPRHPADHPYVNNLWHLPQADPYHGDVANSYNDGPTQPGAEALGGFYELETLSPAAELARGESVRHIHRTFHILYGRADDEGRKRASDLANLVLGVSLEELTETVGQP